MKLMGALLITLSSLTPASSVFIIVPGIVEQAGSGALISFCAAAAVSLMIALVYAELCSAFPLTGGEYAVVGRVLGPFPGFIVLGVNLLVLLLNISVIALGIGPYLSPLMPGLSNAWAALISVIFTTLCGVLNLRTNALITGAFLALEMLALFVLTGLGLLHPTRPLLPLLTHPVVLQGTALLPATLRAIGLAGSASIFALYGFGNAIFLGEETHDAPSQIARAVLFALFIGFITQIIPLAAVLTGARDLATLFAAGDSMFGAFVADRGGPGMSAVISLCIALAIINCNIAFVVLVARLLFSTGRDKVWPAPVNRALLLIHPRFGSPWVATLACGFLAASFCFVPLSLLEVLTGTTIVVVYGSLCVSALVGRRTGCTSHAWYKMPFHPVPSLLGLGGLAFVIYASALDPVLGQPSLIATAVVIVLTAAYYWLVLRRRGAWVLYAPVSEVRPGALPLDPAKDKSLEPSV
jgi:amino acid transporter